MTSTQNPVKIMGITDETSVCECCGKTNLKRVVVLELADGSIVRYGCDCAARTLSLSRLQKAQIDELVHVQKYIAKWSQKYAPEIVNKGINNKLGYRSELKDGHYHIIGVGVV